MVNKEFPLLGNKSAASVLDRMHVVYGVKNDNQLGEALQVNRSTLGNWRARDSVPYTICVDLAESRGISLDWLLTGEGSMHRGEGGSAYKAPAHASEPREAELLGHFVELDESTQLEVLGAARLRRRVDSLERQLQELQATVATLIRSP